MKRIIALIITFIMVFTLCACGGKGNNLKTENGFIFKGSSSTVNTVPMGVPETKLNASDIYAKLEYTEQMFFGIYSLLGGDAAEEKFGAETNYVKFTHCGEEIEISAVPMCLESGKNTLNHMVYDINGYNWTRVHFMRNYGTNVGLDTMLCAYTVEGNKLILKPLEKFEADKDNKTIEYAFNENTLEYTFAFKGRHLTLSNGDTSVDIMCGLDAYSEKDHLYIDNYLSENSEALDGIDNITFRYSPDDDMSRMYFEGVDGEQVYDGIAEMTEDGLFTFTVPWVNGTKTYQYVYFLCGDDGIVLTDGENNYYYNDSYSDRIRGSLSDYVTEDQTGTLDALSDAQIEAIYKKKENLMDDLVSAFEKEGITVTADEKTGELALDSSVLFGGDSAVLTDKGKEFLNKFVAVYSSVIFNEKYQGFVAKTLIEGHVAPVSGVSYDEGMPFSKQRANTVKDYCESKDEKLASTLEAVGYSNSKPVKDKNGKVDMAASRRVSFRFIINISQ